VANRSLPTADWPTTNRRPFRTTISSRTMLAPGSTPSTGRPPCVQVRASLEITLAGVPFRFPTATSPAPETMRRWTSKPLGSDATRAHTRPSSDVQAAARIDHRTGPPGHAVAGVPSESLGSAEIARLTNSNRHESIRARGSSSPGETPWFMLGHTAFAAQSCRTRAMASLSSRKNGVCFRSGMPRLTTRFQGLNPPV